MSDIDKKQFLDLTGLTKYDEKIKVYIDNKGVEYDPAGTAQTKVNELANGQVKTNKEAIEAINADVDALGEKIGDVDSLGTTSKVVVTAINEVLAAVGTGGTAAVVGVSKSTDGLTYTITQGGVSVGTIDIPKDMVVESGEVVTNPEGQAEGTYIKLVLANVAEPLFINVGTLVDIYKAKAEATQVQVAIDSATREISATIVAGSVTATELADNAVTTVKIADANVTKAKLSTEVQSLLETVTTNKEKLDDITEGAQVNVIETVKVNGQALTVTDKAVDIAVPTDNTELINGAGYLVASDIENKVDKATTLAGYGIADAYTSAQTDTAIANAMANFVEVSEQDILNLFKTTTN